MLLQHVLKRSHFLVVCSFTFCSVLTYVTLAPEDVNKASKRLLHRYATDLPENFPCEMLLMKKNLQIYFWERV